MSPIHRSFARAGRLGLEALGWLGPFYRARERRIARRSGAWRDSDGGLPTPPPLLVARVAGHADLGAFLEQGVEIASFLELFAARNGASLHAGEVLDFGCGCGRLARFVAPRLAAAGGAYTGVDINSDLVRWCSDALPGRYLVNGLRPPAPLRDGAFDCLFSVSVFTHLPRASMEAWLRDFARMLRPGGVALVSFADEARARLADIERGAHPLRPILVRDGFATSTRALEGSNFMSSYATHAAFREMAAELFEVLEIAPSAETGQSLAWAALRRGS